jgi:predicted protein tyrosine phosphatase
VRSSSEFVDFRITVCGVAELQDFRATAVTHVLSILDPGSPIPEHFGAYGEHERLDLRFNDIIDDLPGQRWAQPEDIDRLLRFGRDLTSEENAHLLVHCQMGVSRSAASMLLILAQARPDRSAAEAMAELVRIRGRVWPNLRVVELGDAALGRGGELIAAAHERYREMSALRPDVVQFMRGIGRLREVDGDPAYPPRPALE